LLVNEVAPGIVNAWTLPSLTAPALVACVRLHEPNAKFANIQRQCRPKLGLARNMD
jgi:hypothetical protein